MRERYIVHNFMICQDIVGHYGRKNVIPTYIMNFDTKKSYDTINRDIVQEMMEALQFPSTII